MEQKELLKKVRKLEIKSRGLSAQLFSGQYHSAFKGRGMSFSEVREYQPGDDVRTIDWNVSARLNHPYVKVYEEERELTIMLVVDVSGSKDFGTQVQFKMELVTEVCAVLAFSAMQNNDKIGVIFFSDKIEKYIPPKKGKSHILRIIRELIDFRPENRLTNIDQALKFLTNVIRKRCTAFVLSDFYGKGYEDTLKIANKKHDIVALRVTDPREISLPDVGLVRFRDAETGEAIWVDTSDRAVRKSYEIHYKKHEDFVKSTLSKAGVDQAVLHTDRSYIQPLSNLFKRRGTR
ncbi:MAG TPA: DUF58 domain-containing protein [Flavobacteriales bacterium]|nr:DUF58 domain-containing protein [Flavobacteriales bacterium]HPH82937.1 DUF58 domain-containing protein [Flavobacteriales bacterium]